ncbi:ABC transporter substrate-binding protein [Lacinutrix sp.]|uniref:ABC transporter substrate-binding protein n=1 Tax=Lacinutrix sp. TaxID=1937692 RepID=UPI0025BC0439|nr:ABC transporter substrate-binding protein [Lacinutrix sp.]
MKLIIFRNTFLILILLVFSSCKEDKEIEIKLSPLETKSNTTVAYAEGFSITKNNNHNILEIKSPWPESNQTFKYVLISKEEASKTTFMRDQYDGIIITPIKKIVVTSTTHIPALELLNAENTLVGFPGTDYISSEKTRARIDNKQVRELGKNEGINTEVLLDINPNVVIAFGVDGKSKSLETIKKANIPVIYNGDWVEKSPLAKAEWIKFFGALYNKEKDADSIFRQIETDYNEAKKLAFNAKTKPTILCGAMYKDIWYLPNGTSTEAQFLKDANTNYLWSDTTDKGSIALNFEVVFSKAKSANLWLSPSYYSSKDALVKASNHYAKFDAFKNDNIYTFSNTTGKTGGVLYYELGTARPDLVLKDIIKICHPELLPDYEPYFFRKLK